MERKDHQTSRGYHEPVSQARVPLAVQGLRTSGIQNPQAPWEVTVLSSPLGVSSSLVMLCSPTVSCPEESRCSVKACGLSLNSPVFTPSLLKGAVNFNAEEAMIGRPGVT